MTEEEIAHFFLDDTRRDAVYTDRIQPRLFADKHPTALPQAFIIAAQPGAGKTGVNDQILKDEFPDGNVVLIDTDKLRDNHPDIDDISKLDDKLQSLATHPDANHWSTRAIMDAADGHYNLLAEKTLGDPDKAGQLCGQLREKDSEVTVVFKAVHERESSLRMYQRYEKEKALDGAGRLPPQDYHDKCYEGLVATAKLLEQEKLADRIIVFDDKGEKIHDSKLVDGRWTIPHADRAIERGREDAPRLLHEYNADWQEKVFGPMKDRGASAQEINEVKLVAQHHMNQLELLQERTVQTQELNATPREDWQLAVDLKLSCDRIAGHTSAGREKFEEKTAAVVSEFRSIADTCRAVSEDFATKHSELPWKDVASYANNLTSAGGSPEPDKLWHAATNVIPPIAEGVTSVLNTIRAELTRESTLDREDELSL